MDFERIGIDSRIPSLKLSMLHLPPKIQSQNEAVLFLHGASFPSSLAFGFRMDGYSWMDDLSLAGYDVYALDFLGYGESDRYPEMWNNTSDGPPLGRAREIQGDVNNAVDYILKITQNKKLTLIAHSWGGSVAMIYASENNKRIKNLILFSSITQRHDTTETEAVDVSYHTMTPDKRVRSMDALVPGGEDSQLEAEVFDQWKDRWIKSDPIAVKKDLPVVRFPSGWAADVEELQHGKSLFDPANITAPVLIIRGEWDQYPSDTDARNLLEQLVHAARKKYVIISSGTHVMHLEKARYKLYEAVKAFLKN